MKASDLRALDKSGTRWSADDLCRLAGHRQCRECDGCRECSECQCDEPEPLMSPYAGGSNDSDY